MDFKLTVIFSCALIDYLIHIYDTKKENSGPDQQITYLGTSFDTGFNFQDLSINV